MEPTKRTTRNQRKAVAGTSDASPLRELKPATRQRNRGASRSIKKTAESENDDADAQRQQPHTRQHPVTSPSQSPQPLESHSEPEQVAESRSTSPPDQQQPSHHYTRSATRSTSPSRMLGAQGKPVSKAKNDGKKGRAGRPAKGSAKNNGPGAHQGVGSAKFQGGKRTYKDMANASDADGEEAGEDQRPVKYHKTVHPGPPEDKYKDDRGVKRRHEPSTHQGTGSSDSEADPAINGPPAKRQRPSDSKPPSPAPARRLSSPRTSSFSKGPFSYTGSPLTMSPCAANPFALIPAHTPFGASPKPTYTTIQEKVVTEESPVRAIKPITSTPKPTQFGLIELPASTQQSSQQLTVYQPPADHDLVESQNSVTKSLSSRRSPLPSTQPMEIEHPTSSPYNEESYHIEPSTNIFTQPSVPRQSSYTPASRSSTEVNLAADDSKAATTLPHSQPNFSTTISNTPRPFFIEPKNRLPPKPASRTPRQIPTIPTPSPLYARNSIDGPDFEDSILLSDDESPEDMEKMKQKSRAWKQDYHKVLALEKEAKRAREMLQLGEALGAEFTRQTPQSNGTRRRKQVAHPAVSSRKSSVRTIHDHVVGSNPSPSPSEVVSLVQNPTLRQSSEATVSMGQKADSQHGTRKFASKAKASDRSPSEDLEFSEEELLAEEDRDDTILSVAEGGEDDKVPDIQATPAPKTGGWLSTLKSSVQTLMTPFTFKGKSSSTNAPGTEFTFSRKHNLSPAQTPTRTTRPKAKAQSERRSRTQPSRSTIAQTERKRRLPSKIHNTISSSGLTNSQPFAVDPDWKRVHAEKALKTALEYEAKVRASAQEFANTTSKIRAQTRSNRNDEVEIEDHNHNSFKAPDPNDSDSTDDESAPESPLSRVRRARSNNENKELGAEANNRGTFRAPSPSDSEDDDSNLDEQGPLKKRGANERNATEGSHASPSRRQAEITPASRHALAKPSVDSASSVLMEQSTLESIEGTSAETAEQGGEGTWNQTPPPKPRPGNAQLPQPAPTPVAIANAQKYQPKKPSGLRNVMQMSPLHKETESLDPTTWPIHVIDLAFKVVDEDVKLGAETVVHEFQAQLEKRLDDIAPMNGALEELCPPKIQKMIKERFFA